tara:strand:- start:406 stop:666 length:261 start_codon:yes stop_codon:yes gene_type:complete
MPLKSTTTVEYDFNNAYLYYCKDHNCFRVSDNHEDSVLLNGVTPDKVNDFISNYIEYVLKDTDLKEAFEDSVKGESVMYLSKEENE